MASGMKRKLGLVCMVLGVLLLAVSAGLLLYTRAVDDRAGAAARDVMEQLEAVQPSTAPDPYDAAMTVVEIDGQDYIGYVEIPGLELKLPVMADWSYPQLQIAPCRYMGSTKTDDLVVMAHNYSKHFGGLQYLVPGDAVVFTDMDGVVSVYEVMTLETLAPTAVEDMTAGEYDLTLFTCTYGGKSRVTVRCNRSE